MPTHGGAAGRSPCPPQASRCIFPAVTRGGSGTVDAPRDGSASLSERVVGRLFPGSFALVMATGIISSALSLLGFRSLAIALLVANALFFVALWILTLARIVSYFPRVRADLRGHATGSGFFTVVAGTCVLGTQIGIVTGWYGLALGLWIAGIVLWLFLTYTFFASVIAGELKPEPSKGMHGGWLVSVVATQSVSVLATVLVSGFPARAQALLVTALCFSFAGAMLYVIIITLLVYRLVFSPVAPAELSPLSWVAMGAAAISTLSGARLLGSAGSWSFIQELRPFLLGYTLFFWSVASWWIPLLLVLGVWRHLIRRHPLRYEPQYWGLVFPLGMYTACTTVLARASGLGFLIVVPTVSLWIAVTAWLLTLVGMSLSIARTLARREKS